MQMKSKEKETDLNFAIRFIFTNVKNKQTR